MLSLPVREAVAVAECRVAVAECRGVEAVCRVCPVCRVRNREAVPLRQLPLRQLPLRQLPLRQLLLRQILLLLPRRPPSNLAASIWSGVPGGV